MRLTERQLRTIISRLLNEDDHDAGDVGTNVLSSLGDDEDEDDVNVSVNYQQMFEKAKNSAKQKLANSSIPDTVVRKIIPMLDRVNIVFVRTIKDHEGNNEKSLAAVHHVIVDTKTGKPSREPLSKDMEFLDNKSRQYCDIYKDKPFQNPIILVAADTMKPLSQETMNHEFDHIKNNFVAMIFPSVNLIEVKNVLRTDLQGKEKNEIADIFVEEGYYVAAQAKSGVSTIFDYYQNAMSKNPNHRLVDEIAVRVNEMMRQPGIDVIIKMINSKDKNLTYRYVMRTLRNENAAQIIPFLKKDIKVSTLKQIVMLPKDKFSQPA